CAHWASASDPVLTNGTVVRRALSSEGHCRRTGSGGSAVRRSGPASRSRDRGFLPQGRAQGRSDEAAAQPPAGAAEQGVHGGDGGAEVVAAREVGPPVVLGQREERLEEGRYLR